MCEDDLSPQNDADDADELSFDPEGGPAPPIQTPGGEGALLSELPSSDRLQADVSHHLFFVATHVPLIYPECKMDIIYLKEPDDCSFILQGKFPFVSCH